MAGAWKSLYFLLVLSVVFLLLPVSVMCNDVEELDQESINDNLTISYNHTFPYLMASFGGLLGKQVDYHVSVASPNRNACDPIDPPPIKDHLTAQFWIVVIQRKDCLFVEKIKNAQDAGYHAAIIHNIGSNNLVFMSGNDANDIIIPAFFIGQDDGTNLTNEYFQALEHGQTLVLSMETNGLEVFNVQEYLAILADFQRYFPLAIVCILLIGLLFLTYRIFVYKYSIHRQKKRLAELCILSNSLATLPTKTFKSNDPYETCAICFEDYRKGNKLRLLHCSHAFHCNCIDHWLANHRRICPLCNQRVESQQTSVV